MAVHVLNGDDRRFPPNTERRKSSWAQKQNADISFRRSPALLEILSARICRLVSVLLITLAFCVPFASRGRLNGLRSVVAGEAALLSHVAQLDLRDAGLRELDVRSLTGLEVLRCDRNALGRLRVAGRALKSLHAAHNGGFAPHTHSLNILNGRGKPQACMHLKKRKEQL